MNDRIAAATLIQYPTYNHDVNNTIAIAAPTKPALVAMKIPENDNHGIVKWDTLIKSRRFL